MPSATHLHNGQMIEPILFEEKSKEYMGKIKKNVGSNVNENYNGVESDLDPSMDIDKDEASLAWLNNGVTYLNGPDQILPSTVTSTHYPNGATLITPVKEQNTEPISVPTLLRKCAESYPNTTALRVKRNGSWLEWSYKAYLQDVRTAAKGFISLGLEPYHSVCILGFNSPEWFISDLSAIFAGGLAAGIYTTNTADTCHYIGLDSRAQIYVVEDEKQLAKILEIRDRLPNLKAIIQYTGTPTETGVLSWTQLLTLGQQQSDSLLESRLQALAINLPCTVIYTSGTTGPPKGVMLSHDNLTWMSLVNKHWGQFLPATDTFQERIVSFLPLSHVAAQMADIYCPLSVGCSVTFADKNALRGSLVDDLKLVTPSKFLAVPRVWEKMHEKITEIGSRSKGLKRLVAMWAKKTGLEVNMKKMNGVSNPESLQFKLADRIIFSKVKAALGLSNCTLNLSGAAPISPDVLRFFLSLNIILTEAYGMSECSGPHCMGKPDAFRIGSVGKTMSGCETLIKNKDRDGNGEVLMKGRHRFVGYLGQDEKTREAIDKEGYLHTQDIGRLDSDGFLFITGRLKEILITAGGENVAPVPIEDNVKSQLSSLSQCVVIGDRMRFLSVLVTLKTEVDATTQEPTQVLTKPCKDWIQEKGSCSVSTVQDVLQELYVKKNEKLTKAIQSGIDGANAKATSRAQLIQKWVVLPCDFSISGGELGPTLKLKRSVVYEKYAETLAELYREVKKK